MKRLAIQVKNCSKRIDELINRSDFDEFERYLVENPNSGVVIPGLGGIRKIRLKGADKGKRGGFRVDYLDIPSAGWLYLLVIYSKNENVDLNPAEKKMIKQLAEKLKKEANNAKKSV